MKRVLELTEFKTFFDNKLSFFLYQKKKQAAKIDPKCALLIDEIIRLNRSGGKRLRAYFSYLGYGLNQTINKTVDDKSTAWDIFLVPELIQSMALLHDDIMDESLLRRGQITTYKKYGRDTAILAGDILFSLMDELATNTNIFAQQAHNQLKFDIVCGQYLDISYKLQVKSYKLAEKEILKIYKYKSAMYTVVCPLQYGYLAAFGRGKREITQPEKNNLRLLEQYGEKVGIGFQLIDDLLDLYGKPRVGKTIGQDIREGKRTLLVVKLLHKTLPQKVKKRFLRLFGNNNLGESDIKWIKILIARSDVKQECQLLADKLIKKGQKAIMAFSGNEEAKQKLMEIAEFIGKRDY